MNVRFMECGACQGEGRRRVYHHPAPWEASPCNERDDGECRWCAGTGLEIIEVEPVTLDDLAGDQ